MFNATFKRMVFAKFPDTYVAVLSVVKDELTLIGLCKNKNKK